MSMMFGFYGAGYWDIIWQEIMGVDFIVIVECHHNVINANNKQKPAWSQFRGQKAAYCIGVLGLTIHTELKAADMLTSRQLLSVLKGASKSRYAESVKSNLPHPSHFSDLIF